MIVYPVISQNIWFEDWLQWLLVKDWQKITNWDAFLNPKFDLFVERSHLGCGRVTAWICGTRAEEGRREEDGLLSGESCLTTDFRALVEVEVPKKCQKKNTFVSSERIVSNQGLVVPPNWLQGFESVLHLLLGYLQKGQHSQMSKSCYHQCTSIRCPSTWHCLPYRLST